MAYKGVLPWRRKTKLERIEVITVGEIEGELSNKLDKRKIYLFGSVPCMFVFFRE